MIECVSVVHAAGEVAVEVTMNNADYTSSAVQFKFMPEIEVSSVSPAVGTTSGGTVVSVKGSAFTFSQNLQCRFGLAAVAATFVSTEEVKCVAPAADAGSVAVSVTGNGVDFSITSAQYEYSATAKVSIAPDAGVVGELNATAQAIGADLIIAGAYGQSRLREWVFGGVTRTLMDEPTCHLLLSH